jgi:hypothetical protein
MHLQSSFAMAMQVLLLVATLAATFLAAPALIAVCARRVLSTRSRDGRTSGDGGMSTPRKQSAGEAQNRQGEQLRRHPGLIQNSSVFHCSEHDKVQHAKPALSYIAGWLAAIRWPLVKLSAVDAWVCHTLKHHIRPLVSAGLIVTTLLGALLLSAFFTVHIGMHIYQHPQLTQASGSASDRCLFRLTVWHLQCVYDVSVPVILGQESKEAVAAVREALPRAWAANATFNDSAAGPAFWPVAPVRRALLQHSPRVADAAGQALPWLEARLATAVQQYNLTQVGLHPSLHTCCPGSQVLAASGPRWFMSSSLSTRAAVHSREAL